MGSEDAPQESNDLLEEIYDDAAPGHSIIPRKEFKPWHHPRKHWVRINQLCQLAQKLIAETHFSDETLRYLTLPGEELLDIQALEGVLDKVRAKHLKYTGFNEIGEDTERRGLQNYAERIIADKDTVLMGPGILNGRIQDIASRSSLAYKTVKENGPFNLINLDLCNSIANTSPDHEDDTYFDAIARILELQRKHMAEPFIIFISTRTGIRDINSKSLERIIGVHNENIDRSDEFKNVFEGIVEQEANSLLSELLQGSDVSQDILNRVFGVGLGKWLLQLMRSSTPYWDVTLEHLCCYSVYEEKPNMLTMAFKFKKVDGGMIDKLGLTKILAGQKKVAQESELAISMLEKSKQIINVDTLLENNLAEREKIIKQAAKLLTGVGYSEEGYLNWANSFFPDSAQTATA